MSVLDSPSPGLSIHRRKDETMFENQKKIENYYISESHWTLSEATQRFLVGNDASNHSELSVWRFSLKSYSLKFNQIGLPFDVLQGSPLWEIRTVH